MAILQNTIQDIIDTHAFCSSLIDHLNDTITILNRKYNADAATVMLSRSQILLEHLRVNYDELKLDQTESPRRLQFDDFKLMLNECAAALEICSPEKDARRIVKRFRILLSVVKKFKNTLNDESSGGASKTDSDFTFGNVSSPQSQLYDRQSNGSSMPLSMQGINGSSEEASQTYFKSFGITSASCSILYENKSKRTVNNKQNTANHIMRKLNKSKFDKSKIIMC